MKLSRREFIGASTLAATAGMAAGFNSCSCEGTSATENTLPDTLQAMTSDVQPITVDERIARIGKAQQLMKEQNIAATVLDAGSSLLYFTGISWWPSERTMVAIIPASGEVKYICPGFEEARLRELIKIGTEVYAWQEHESPYKLIADTFKKEGITKGTIGIEEQLRFFILDGVRKEAPHLNFVSGDPVVVPCRIIKSSAELALMQKATDVTVAAMTIGIKSLKEGMSPPEFEAIVNDAHIKLGGVPIFADVNFDKASAFPHGSIQPQRLKKGDIVLMDCGCRVEGYCSDVTRTIVFGAEPTQRQKEIWDLEQKAQAAGFAAAKIGVAMEEIDAAARKVITDAGFGPDYKLPGVPHRTGHGIGTDVHEWGNAVRGNKQLLQPGMCFSIEPTISIIGEFGIRHEDCVYMTASGPKWFSTPSISITQPFASIV